MDYERVTGKRYRVLHPRPAYVLIVGEWGGDDRGIMAASWVMPLSEEPERLLVAWDKETHSLSVLRKIGVFTVNVVGPELVDLVWRVGSVSGWKVDKFREYGIEVERARSNGGMVLKGALGWVEARVYRIIEDLAEDVDLVVADVVDAYARKDLYDTRYGWRAAKAGILLHASGRAFFTPGRMVLAEK